MSNRPIVVRLIATYLWLKAIVLMACVIAMHFRPSVRGVANGVIEDLVPMIAGLRTPDADIWLAPLFAIIDTVLGTGIWFRQGWARVVIVIDLTWLFGRAAFGVLLALAALHSKVHFRTPSPYFVINIVASLTILGCLLDPDIKRFFQKS